MHAYVDNYDAVNHDTLLLPARLIVADQKHSRLVG